MLVTALILAAAIVSAVGAVAAAYFSWKGSRQTHEVHLSLNSRLDALLAKAEETGRYRGAEDALRADKVIRGESLP